MNTRSSLSSKWNSKKPTNSVLAACWSERELSQNPILTSWTGWTGLIRTRREAPLASGRYPDFRAWTKWFGQSFRLEIAEILRSGRTSLLGDISKSPASQTVPPKRLCVVSHASGRIRCDTRASTCPDACFLYMPEDSTTSRCLSAWLECMRRDTPASGCRFAFADCKYRDTSSYKLHLQHPFTSTPPPCINTQLLM
ncbi:hypothetical protein YC2023_004664 [Brassica napus]